MGGCCSKGGNYLPGTPKEKAQSGDTPKLSRLQHKESFNGPQTVLTNGHKNGEVKATEELLKSETVAAEANKNDTENTSTEEHVNGNVTSISVSEIPQVSKVHLGGDVKEEVKVIQKNEESTQNSSLVTNEATTVSVTQAAFKESKEVAEKTVVMIKNDEATENISEQNSVVQEASVQSSSIVQSSTVNESSSLISESSSLISESTAVQ